MFHLTDSNVLLNLKIFINNLCIYSVCECNDSITCHQSSLKFVGICTLQNSFASRSGFSCFSLGDQLIVSFWWKRFTYMFQTNILVEDFTCYFMFRKLDPLLTRIRQPTKLFNRWTILRWRLMYLMWQAV